MILSMSKESGCSHVEHRHIDEPCQTHSNHHIWDAPAKDTPRFLLTARDDAMLGERGVQVDDMRHHRGPNDTYREEDALRPAQPGNNGMEAHLAPIRTGEEGLDQVTNRNHPHQGRDHGFQTTEPAALQL